MRWLEHVVAAFHPATLIPEESWRIEWARSSRRQFIVTARVVFPVIALAYIANYYFFDVPMGLEPSEFWFRFRLTMAGLCLVTFLAYISPLSSTIFYKVPAIIALVAICYSQARVVVWYGDEAWVFFFGFVLASVVLLKVSLMGSMAFALCVIGSALPSLQSGGLDNAKILSGTIVTIGVVMVLRAGATADVRAFLLNQENLAAQRRLNDLSQEYAERVRSFIPRVIADRLSELVERKGYSVVEASVEVLKARKKMVSCLFTDIRGYTRESKDVDKFVSESVLPEVKACSDAIESLSGIPRKIGDLIFAYFDSDDPMENAVRCLRAAVEVSRINESMNATVSSVHIRRYILLSSGEAIVGNFGGLDSSIEITALGSPVNFLSRVDELTKAPKMSKLLEVGDIVLGGETVNLLEQAGLKLPLELVDLAKLSLEVRDFPEIDKLWSLRPSDAVYGELEQVVASIAH